MGRLLPGGRYQADDGFVYPSYQAAANRGQDLRAIQNVGSSILRGLSNPLGLINQYEAARKGGFGFGRSANAMEAPNSRTQLVTSGDADLGNDPGQMFPAGRKRTDDRNLPSGDRGRAPITSPNTTFQHADDEYNRLISQYGPSGIQQLAGMTSLPTGFTPTGSNKPASLKDYYGAQTLQGSANLGSIISEMGYKGDMAKWAQANPMLAQREYDKRFGGATLASAVHPDGSVRGMPQAISGLDTSKMMPTAAMQGTAFPGQGQGPTFNPAAFTDKSDFGTPANGVPAHPINQGGAVSAPYAEAQRQAAEKTLGATGMPQLPTLGGDWLSKVMASPWGQALKNTGGAMGIDYLQGIR